MKPYQDAKTNENLTIRENPNKNQNFKNEIENNFQKNESDVNKNKDSVNQVKVYQNQGNKTQGYNNNITPTPRGVSKSKGSDSNGCGKDDCLRLLIIAIDVAIIVLIAYIFSMTETNPLETFMLENMNFTLNISKENVNQKNQKTFNDESIKEETVNKRKNLLRHLDTDCDVLNFKMEKNNYRLDETFDLGFKQIHKMALGILIIYCISLGLLILIFCSAFGFICCKDCCEITLGIFGILLFIVNILGAIANLVLVIIMMVNYYKGYTTGDFLAYYKDCLNNDLKLQLESTYNKLDDLNKFFISFIVLYFVEMFLNRVVSCLNKKEDKS